MSLRRVGTSLSALAACLALGAAAEAADKPLTAPVPQIELKDIEQAGSCKGAAGNLDMQEVMFLENRSIDWKFPTKKIRVWLDRDKLHTSDPADPSTGVTFLGVNYLLKGDPDIVLKLAVQDGRLLVYWRETFQHRVFRQGLFVVLEDGRLDGLCEGRAGHWQSH